MLFVIGLVVEDGIVLYLVRPAVWGNIVQCLVNVCLHLLATRAGAYKARADGCGAALLIDSVGSHYKCFEKEAGSKRPVAYQCLVAADAGGGVAFVLQPKAIAHVVVMGVKE